MTSRVFKYPFILLFLLPMFVFASAAILHPLEKLYYKGMLDQKQSEYSNIIVDIVKSMIKELNKNEWQKVSASHIEFPIYFPSQTFPLEFFGGGHPPRIILPIVSVKFIEDLCLAVSWLEKSGYSHEPIFNYVTMIKYKKASEFDGGRYPLLLDALGIPKAALQDNQTRVNAGKCFGSALAFITAHELGHIIYRHPGYLDGIPRSKLQENESRADDFAFRMMSRLNLPPFGAAVYFLAAAYASPMPVEFGSNEAWIAFLESKATHPFTPSRLESLASAFQEYAGEFSAMESPTATSQMIAVAGQIRQIAKTLRDVDIQLLIKQRGLWADERSLKPQTWAPPDISLDDDQIVGRRKSIPELAKGGSKAFAGPYVGKFSTHGAGKPSEITTRLRREGNQLEGTYEYRLGRGTLSGRVVGRTAHLRWREGAYFGKAKFRVELGGNEFSGSWGYKESDQDGGFWDGVRD